MRERNWERVREILEGEKRTVTLDLAFVELYNVLWKRVYLLRDQLDVERLTASAGLFTSIVEVKTAHAYLRDALDIGLREGLPVYDSLFIALARSEGDLLVTSDKRQYEVGTKYVKVIYVG